MKRHVSKWAVAVLLAAIATQPAFSDNAARLNSGVHPITLQDTLQMDHISDVVADPSGRRVIFRRSRADMGDFSLESQSGMLGELYVYEIGTNAPAHRLVGDRNDWDGARLISFSPDGHRAILNWLQHGALKIGVFDFATNALRELSVVPAFLRFSDMGQNVVWVSASEFVCNALPDGEQTGAVVYSRRALSRKLTALWENAWRGDRATADELESHTGYPDWPARKGSLVRVDASSGTVRKIAEGVYFGMVLSPDGRYLAAARQGGWHQPDPGQLFDQTGYRNDFRRYDGVIFDLRGGGAPVRVNPAFQLMLSRFTWTWSTDSRTVSYYAARGDKRWKEGNFFLYDLMTGKSHAISIAGLEMPMVREIIDYRFQEAVPVGSGLAVFGFPVGATKSTEAASHRSDWYYVNSSGDVRNLTGELTDVSGKLVGHTKEALYVLAGGSLWNVPVEGAPRNATPALNVKLAAFFTTVPRAPASGSVLQAVLYTQDLTHVMLFDAERGILWNKKIPEGIDQMLAIAAPSAVEVVSFKQAAGDSLSIVDPDGNVTPFWAYNQNRSSIVPAKLVPLRYKLEDGTPMSGGALLPPNLKPGTRAPVVVEVYPGLGDGLTPGDYTPGSAELFTSMGYILLVPSAPEGRIGNSSGALGNWENLVEPALDALIKAGYADPDRVAVLGSSQGGWSALAMLEQTARFKAGIVEFSTGNFLSLYGGGYLMADLFPNEIFPSEGAGAYESVPGYHLSLGASPWDDPLVYVRASPFFNIQKIQTPVMLIDSDLDPFSMNNMTQIYTALFRLRKEAQFVRYWGEPHGLYSPANIRDSWARQFAWLDRWCDIARDAKGSIMYASDRPRSRHESPPLAPSDFLKWTWFFGPDRAAGEYSPAAPESQSQSGSKL
jgi:dipeptidyl aminopeptidase/acylaminoacyl peptidase